MVSDPFTQYQQWKVFLVDVLAVTADAFHIYLGLILFMVSCAVLRRVTLGSVVLGFLVSVALEILDLLYQASFIGTLDWPACVHDLIHTNLAPFLIVVVVSYWRERSRVITPMTGS